MSEVFFARCRRRRWSVALPSAVAATALRGKLFKRQSERSVSVNDRCSMAVVGKTTPVSAVDAPVFVFAVVFWLEK